MRYINEEETGPQKSHDCETWLNADGRKAGRPCETCIAAIAAICEGYKKLYGTEAPEGLPSPYDEVMWGE